MATSRSSSPKPVVIVAGGPSVTLADVRTIGMARSQDRCRVMAINDAVYPCWFADHLHAADRAWWNENRGVQFFFGMKTALESTKYHDVVTLVNTGVAGYDKAPGFVRTGMNSAYQAVHIAAQNGAEQIILLGMDFTNDGARVHWFGHHRPGMDKMSAVGEWRRLFRGLTDELQGMGIEILNASNRSTIDWLPKFKIQSLIET